MSIRGRELQVGDYATTDFNGQETRTLVKIIGRQEVRGCQSGILFSVYPTLRNGDLNSRYDADWFEPSGGEG